MTRARVDLETLVVWAYRRQRVIEMTGLRLEDETGDFLPDAPEDGGESRCGCAALDRYARVGVRIDGGRGAAAGGRDVHPDAERLHRAVLRIARADMLAALLVVRFGRDGAPPDWRTTEPRPLAVPAEGPGRVRHKVEETRETLPSGRAVRVSWCPLVYWPPREYVDTTRAEYAAWHAAMMRLLGELMVGPPLDGFLLSGFAAPARPWETRLGSSDGPWDRLSGGAG